MRLKVHYDGVTPVITLCFMLHLYGLHKVWCCINTQDRQVMLRVCGDDAGGELR